MVHWRADTSLAWGDTLSSNVSFWVALGVTVSVALTDLVYVLYTTEVVKKRSVHAASLSSLWHLLAAFAIVSYTHNPVYVAFAALGSWVGVFFSTTWVRRREQQD